MRVRVESLRPDELRVAVEGEGHTLMNLLVSRLNEDERVTFAAYRIEHPLVGPTRMTLRTSGAAPLEVLRDAVEGLAAELEELRRVLASELRGAGQGA